MHFVTHLVTKYWGLNVLQSANHRDHSCTFGKSWGLNTLQSAYHKNHLCTFEKLGAKSKILVNHRNHPCTLLYFEMYKICFAGETIIPLY
ncbi:hypothetical protein Hanom_Chr07g00597581 [Helianthus anomalus]